MNKQEPDPGGASSCPSWLSPYAKVEWKRLAPELKRLGLLTQADRSAYAAYCQAWADFRMITERMREEEVGSADWYRLAREHSQVFRNVLRGAAEFGLSPSARSQIAVSTASKDELSEFLEAKPELKVAKAEQA